VAVVGKIKKKIGKRQLFIKGETISNTIQKHRTHKIKKNYKTGKQAEKEY